MTNVSRHERNHHSPAQHERRRKATRRGHPPAGCGRRARVRAGATRGRAGVEVPPRGAAGEGGATRGTPSASPSSPAQVFPPSSPSEAVPDRRPHRPAPLSRVPAPSLRSAPGLRPSAPCSSLAGRRAQPTRLPLSLAYRGARHTGQAQDAFAERAMARVHRGSRRPPAGALAGCGQLTREGAEGRFGRGAGTPLRLSRELCPAHALPTAHSASPFTAGCWLSTQVQDADGTPGGREWPSRTRGQGPDVLASCECLALRAEGIWGRGNTLAHNRGAAPAERVGPGPACSPRGRGYSTRAGAGWLSLTLLCAPRDGVCV